MTDPDFASPRFTVVSGQRITVQVPGSHVTPLLQAIQTEAPLDYGDYDHVSYVSAPGQQRFRSTGQGRNRATDGVVMVPCTELSVFVPDDRAVAVLQAIYAAHPYEEPVIFLTACRRTGHVRGMDEDNPNRFWNGATPDWVPAEHRGCR